MNAHSPGMAEIYRKLSPNHCPSLPPAPPRRGRHMVHSPLSSAPPRRPAAVVGPSAALRGGEPGQVRRGAGRERGALGRLPTTGAWRRVSALSRRAPAGEGSSPVAALRRGAAVSGPAEAALGLPRVGGRCGRVVTVATTRG